MSVKFLIHNIIPTQKSFTKSEIECGWKHLRRPLLTLKNSSHRIISLDAFRAAYTHSMYKILSWNRRKTAVTSLLGRNSQNALSFLIQQEINWTSTQLTNIHRHTPTRAHLNFNERNLQSSQTKWLDLLRIRRHVYTDYHCKMSRL